MGVDEIGSRRNGIILFGFFSIILNHCFYVLKMTTKMLYPWKSILVQGPKDK